MEQNKEINKDECVSKEELERQAQAWKIELENKHKANLNKKINKKDYVNINDLTKEKDRGSYSYFLCGIEANNLMTWLMDNNYLTSTKDYKRYVIYNVCLEFIFKNIHIEDYTLDQEGTLWIKFSGNKEATDLISQWESKLINGDVKLDGFGYLSKSNCWNHASFWLSVFYILLMLGKDDKVRTYWVLNLFTCLEVKIIKEWDELRAKNFNAHTWLKMEQDILSYFGHDIQMINKNLNGKVLSNYQKTKKEIDKLTPGYHIEPWLKKEIIKYKNKHSKKSADWWDNEMAYWD